MANKNHSLDKGIESSAMAEFAEKGYEKASLRKIAEAAGVTIGAIYTRYKTKDILFCAMVKPLLDKIEESFESIKEDYFNETQENYIAGIKKAMNDESETILHLLFDDYQRAKLLLCKSGGSSLENFFDIIIQRKIDETVKFFEVMDIKNINRELIKLLINSQFHMYFQIISEGYSLEKAKKIMSDASVYSTGGWLALFEKIKGINGGLK